MPRVSVTSYRVQRYYHPLTIHARFSPERVLTPEPMSKDMVFPREHDGCQPRLQGLVDPGPINDDTSIPKPPGEVTRLRRGGYSLISALGWQEERYDEVQASALLQHKFNSL
jgi:hypothetical protein